MHIKLLNEMTIKMPWIGRLKKIELSNAQTECVEMELTDEEIGDAMIYKNANGTSSPNAQLTNFGTIRVPLDR